MKSLVLLLVLDTTHGVAECCIEPLRHVNQPVWGFMPSSNAGKWWVLVDVAPSYAYVLFSMNADSFQSPNVDTTSVRLAESDDSSNFVRVALSPV